MLRRKYHYSSRATPEDADNLLVRYPLAVPAPACEGGHREGGPVGKRERVLCSAVGAPARAIRCFRAGRQDAMIAPHRWDPCGDSSMDVER